MNYPKSPTVAERLTLIEKRLSDLEKASSKKK
jgi:hypothetical protein